MDDPDLPDDLERWTAKRRAALVPTSRLRDRRAVSITLYFPHSLGPTTIVKPA